MKLAEETKWSPMALRYVKSVYLVQILETAFPFGRP